MTKHNNASQSLIQKFTIFDLLTILLTFSISALLFVFSISGSSDSAKVEITTDTDSYVYSLNIDKSLVFQGPLGKTKVEIANNAIKVVESPGKRQLCIKSGEISQNGEWLACLPNKIFIRIFGTNKKNIDVLSF